MSESIPVDMVALRQWAITQLSAQSPQYLTSVDDYLNAAERIVQWALNGAPVTP